MKNANFVLVVLLFCSISVSSQHNQSEPVVKPPVAHTTTIDLKDMKFIPSTGKSHWKNGEVPNHLDMDELIPNDTIPSNKNFIDPVLQKNYPPPASGSLWYSSTGSQWRCWTQSLHSDGELRFSNI